MLNAHREGLDRTHFVPSGAKPEGLFFARPANSGADVFITMNPHPMPTTAALDRPAQPSLEPPTRPDFHPHDFLMITQRPDLVIEMARQETALCLIDYP